MRKLFLLIFLILSITATSAFPIDSTIAKRVAFNAYKSKAHDASIRTTSTPALVYTKKANPDTISNTPGDTVVCFYIYNIGQGFVIVSADNTIEPILGYSTESNFDPDNIPDNVQCLLDDYRNEIRTIYVNNLPTSANILLEWTQLASHHTVCLNNSKNTNIIGPLITTNWDQGRYYNNLCPTDSRGPNGHVFTGCVATAMGQVINYWHYPTTGIGRKTYTANYASYGAGYGNYGELTADFGSTEYDYSIMPSQLKASSSITAINAVATLLFHCGVSVSMKYGYASSGAFSSTIPGALTSYFGYPTCQCVYRTGYSGDWIALIKSELNMLHPIIYGGGGNNGGHSFVCDGYENQNYFHFNWGWSVAYNGYFILSNLNPGNYTFNTGQTAIIGIHANTPTILSNRHVIEFLSAAEQQSEVTSVQIIGQSLTDSIHITATGDFYVGLDSNILDRDLAIGSNGSTLYIRYIPSSVNSLSSQENLILTSLGANNDTITLIGHSYELHCNPPRNITLSSETNHIAINWEAPSEIQATYNVSLDSTFLFNYGYYGTDYTLNMLHRLCDSDLVQYNGKELIQIKFYALPGVSALRARAYVGGSYRDNILVPGTLRVDQAINLNSIQYNQWNTVTLTSPITIDGTQELWYGIYLEAASGQNALPFGYNYCTTGKGDVIGYYNSPNNISWQTSGMRYNFSLAATFQEVPSSLLGYAIQRNDQFITSDTLIATSFIDTIPNIGLYSYTINTIWSNQCKAYAYKHINITSLNPLLRDTITASICNNESYTFDDTTISNAGTYRDTINGLLIDTLKTLILTVQPTSEYEFDTTVCDSFTWNNETYTQSGKYTHVYQTAHGCDSIIILQLTIHTSPNIIITGDSTIHQGETTTLTASGASNYLWSTGDTTEQISVTPTSDNQLFYVIGADEYGCTAVDSIGIIITGIEENNSNSILIYPNPTSTNLFIRGDNLKTVYLLNAIGKRCAEINSTDGQNVIIPVHNLSNGNYHVIIKLSNNQIITRKIIILKNNLTY